MSRIPSLNILLESAGHDYLQELYGQVIENVQHNTISTTLKNMNLSGDPQSGSVEAKRFVNSTAQIYGTARAAGAGVAVKARPVVVQIDQDKEIVEEIEYKDTILYGVDGLLARRSADHARTMVRNLEEAFFLEAADKADMTITAGATILETVESAIQQVETVRNNFVNGIPRDMLAIIATPYIYGQLRNFLDTNVRNAHIQVDIESVNTFHGVRIWSSIYLPPTAGMIVMAEGSVALPVMSRPYTAEKIPLSEAYAVELYYYYGVKAVTPDLIAVMNGGNGGDGGNG